MQNFKTEKGDPITVPLTIKEHTDGQWIIEKVVLKEILGERNEQKEKEIPYADLFTVKRIDVNNVEYEIKLPPTTIDKKYDLYVTTLKMFVRCRRRPRRVMKPYTIIVGSPSSFVLLLGVLLHQPWPSEVHRPKRRRWLWRGSIPGWHDRSTAKDRPAGMRAYVEAWDVTTNKLLWKVKVYEIVYDQMLETDVQDIYIESRKLEGKKLTVTTERKKAHRVHIERHMVIE